MMEQKNLIMAIGLSLVVLFGSQFLITRCSRRLIRW